MPTWARARSVSKSEAEAIGRIRNAVEDGGGERLKREVGSATALRERLRLVAAGGGGGGGMVHSAADTSKVLLQEISSKSWGKVPVALQGAEKTGIEPFLCIGRLLHLYCDGKQFLEP